MAVEGTRLNSVEIGGEDNHMVEENRGRERKAPNIDKEALERAVSLYKESHL